MGLYPACKSLQQQDWKTLPGSYRSLEEVNNALSELLDRYSGAEFALRFRTEEIKPKESRRQPPVTSIPDHNMGRWRFLDEKDVFGRPYGGSLNVFSLLAEMRRLGGSASYSDLRKARPRIGVPKPPSLTTPFCCGLATTHI